MPFGMFSLRNSLIFVRSAREYFRGGILIGAWFSVSMVKSRSFARMPTGCVRSLQNYFSYRRVRFRKYRRFSRPCNSFPLLQSFGSSLSLNSTNSLNSFSAFSFFCFICSFISICVATSPLYAVMSAGRAKLGSRLGTDRLFPVSDRVQVTILRK